MSLLELTPQVHQVLIQLAFLGLVLFFIVSSVEEVLFTAYYAFRRLAFRVGSRRGRLSFTEYELAEGFEKPIAVLIPAWQEGPALRRMLENTLRVVNYSNYQIFVGTYPNDAWALQEVEAAREQFDNIHRIICPSNGPSNKADCLNWLYQGVRLHEKEKGRRFEILVIHSCQDILHPWSFKLFNQLIPKMDLVQLPVFPLEVRWYQWTAGHYLDEFAEIHGRDLPVRDSETDWTPLTGGGCAFSRRILERLADDHFNQLFNLRSLAVDYDFGMRLRKYGVKRVFASRALRRNRIQRSFWTGRLIERETVSEIATREHFPSSLWATIRLKSRWILGTTLQTWGRTGWWGGLGTRYMLARDRKILLDPFANLLGYILLVGSVLFLIDSMVGTSAYPASLGLFISAGWWWMLHLMFLGGSLLALRSLVRAIFVGRIYGLKQAFLSLPRQFWGTCINAIAATGAMSIYLVHRFSGRPLGRSQAERIFPSERDLQTYHRRLGDLLLERRYITYQQLKIALAHQQHDPRPIGAILVDLGFVKENDLIQVLGIQLKLDCARVDPDQTPLQVLRMLPRSLAVKHSVYPVGLKDDGTFLLASHALLSLEQIEEIDRCTRRPVEITLCTRSDVCAAINRGYRRLYEQDPNFALVPSEMGT